jgi:hypothetical protein
MNYSRDYKARSTSRNWTCAMGITKYLSSSIHSVLLRSPAATVRLNGVLCHLDSVTRQARFRELWTTCFLNCWTRVYSSIWTIYSYTLKRKNSIQHFWKKCSRYFNKIRFLLKNRNVRYFSNMSNFWGTLLVLTACLSNKARQTQYNSGLYQNP